jgi:hypothetical protein
LSNIHASLADGGLLVDIHPVARPKQLVFEQSGTWSHIGVVERTEDFMSSIGSSETMIGRTVEAGLFAPVTSTVHERIDYFESVADWEQHLNRAHTLGVVADESVLKRVLERLDRGEPCLRTESSYKVGTYAKR